MFITILVAFILGYLAIALEHPLKINKAASALITGVVIWLLIMFGRDALFANSEAFKEYLTQHTAADLIAFIVHGEIPKALGETAQILFFLMAAMTIVEIVDVHNGFSIITDRITARKKIPLMWLLSFITFFLSAVLDNLTSTIVMMALLRRLVADRQTRLYFASLVVIAANSGGAWSPIGDVTTIMLWIGGQGTAKAIILRLIIPSIVSIVIPLIIISLFMKGEVASPENAANNHLDAHDVASKKEGLLVFCIGVGGLIFVPIFKTITHLPPYLGMLLSLGILWVITEIMHWHKSQEIRSKFAVASILRRIDTPTILFFLGILTAVSEIGRASCRERV
jgi:Na+/H+ antiporter NhaD/arsenite permease-like protein